MSGITVERKKFSRTLICVPDKSISHRAVMFDSLASGVGEVHGLLLGEDCLSTVDCMRRMGVDIDIKGSTAVIKSSGELKSADLYCGNSGTTMRLLCGLLASRRGEWELSGDRSLSSRPMKRVITPLELMGASINSQSGKAPLKITGQALHPISYDMPVASAQVKSAIILAALGCEGETTITECGLTRDHTEIMLRQMGASVITADNNITVRGCKNLTPLKVNVVGDISSAAYPLVCGLITGGKVTVKNVGLNPTRTGILSVFDEIGAEYCIDNKSLQSGEDAGDITVTGLGKAKPFRITKELIPRLVDEIPVLAVLACYLSGESVITGAEELRVKESDRIKATVNLINQFGGYAEELPDGMVIKGKPLRGGVVFEPNLDHRMAMSAAVAARACACGATVLNPECAAVSYPDFWRIFAGGEI